MKIISYPNSVFSRDVPISEKVRVVVLFGTNNYAIVMTKARLTRELFENWLIDDTDRIDAQSLRLLSDLSNDEQFVDEIEQRLIAICNY